LGEIKEVGKPDEGCVGVYVTMIQREIKNKKITTPTINVKIRETQEEADGEHDDEENRREGGVRQQHMSTCEN